MKKILIASAVLALSSTAAYAADNGFYAGAQAGYGDTGFSTKQAFVTSGLFGFTPKVADISSKNSADDFDSYTASVKSSDFTGGLFAGYQFNQYVALELGYNKYSNTNSKSTGIDYQVFAGNDAHDYMVTSDKTTYLKAKETEQSLDLAAKLMMPIENTGVNLYAKAGIAYVDAHQDIKTGTSYSNSTAYDFINDKNISAANPAGRAASISYSYSTFLPEVGAGVSYDINKNIVVNAGYMHIQGDNALPDINTATVGVAYHFA